MQLVSIASTRVSKRRMHYSIVFDSSYIPEFFETVFDVVYANSEDETFETTKVLDVSNMEQIGNAVIVYGDLVFDDVEDVFRVTVSTTISVRKVVINYEEFDGAGGYTVEKDVDDVVDTPALRPPIPRQEDYSTPWFGTPIGDSVSNVDTEFLGVVRHPETRELVAIFNGPVYNGLSENNVYQTLGRPVTPGVSDDAGDFGSRIEDEMTWSFPILLQGEDSIIQDLVSKVAQPSGSYTGGIQISLYEDIYYYSINYEGGAPMMTFSEDVSVAPLEYFAARIGAGND